MLQRFQNFLHMAKAFFYDLLFISQFVFQHKTSIQDMFNSTFTKRLKLLKRRAYPIMNLDIQLCCMTFRDCLFVDGCTFATFAASDSEWCYAFVFVLSIKTFSTLFANIHINAHVSAIIAFFRFYF